MNVQLFRIDDRLIHGQVVLGWAKYLYSKHVVLCDDEIAENEWESELYLSCVPADIDAKIMNIKEAIRLLNNGLPEPDKTIVLVKSPAVLLHLIDDGYLPEKVNIGGIHYGESRTKYLPYVFLSEQDIADLKTCAKKGVNLYCQDVPNAKVYKFTELLTN